MSRDRGLFSKRTGESGKTEKLSRPTIGFEKIDRRTLSILFIFFIYIHYIRIYIRYVFPELWNYLKDTVCSNNPLSVDDLVDKLMTAVTAIPQPLLNSVVKDTIKKQKSLDEGNAGRAEIHFLL